MWFYSALVALSVGPVQSGVFRLSLGEDRLVRSRVGRRRVNRVRCALNDVGRCGPSWDTMTTLLGDKYSALRVANSLVCLPTALLACVLFGCGLLQLAAAAPIAFLRQDGAFTAGCVAVLAGSAIPGVLTLAVMRLRWRRRVPFEARWIHEARLVLEKYGTGEGGTSWEQADVIPDLSDLLFVLRSKFHGLVLVAPEAEREWLAALLGWQDRSQFLFDVVGPQTETTHAHAREQVEASARLVLGGPRGTAPRPVSHRPRMKSRYSADSATLMLLAGLGTVAGMFAVLSFVWSNPSAMATVTWEGVEPVLQLVGVAIPAGAAFATAVDQWRKRTVTSLANPLKHANVTTRGHLAHQRRNLTPHVVARLAGDLRWTDGEWGLACLRDGQSVYRALFRDTNTFSLTSRCVALAVRDWPRPAVR